MESSALYRVPAIAHESISSLNTDTKCFRYCSGEIQDEIIVIRNRDLWKANLMPRCKLAIVGVQMD
jgi:hypothetical protein